MAYLLLVHSLYKQDPHPHQQLVLPDVIIQQTITNKPP
jgi:hypothetical protein